MRLSPLEIEAIAINFKDVFDECDIYLFGSRVDDHTKGGEIDLYLVPEIVDTESHIEQKLHFLQKIKEENR